MLLIHQDFLKIHNCVIKSSVAIDTELIRTVGGFRGIPEKADYDCWLNVIKLTNLLYIDEPLFYYDGAHGSGQYYWSNNFLNNFKYCSDILFDSYG